MASGQQMGNIFDSKDPITFLFHPIHSTLVSDLVRMNAQNELIKGNVVQPPTLYS
jgi:hypothetical protein